METNRLRQFCVVVETENLRKASEILKLSHSALSKSLKQLQADSGWKLLTPMGRNIAITDEGRIFYQKAKEFLKHEAALLDKSTHTESTKRILKIGTFEVFSTHVLGTLLPRYFPQAAVELHELLPGKLEQALADRKIDLGLTYEPIPLAGVEFIRLGKTEMRIYKRAHALSALKTEDLPFVAPISPIEGSPTGAKGLDGWPEDKISRSVRYRVDMMESGLALARQGAAAIFIPQCVARLHNETVKKDHALLPIALPHGMKPVHRDIYLLKRTNSEETPLLRTLARLIRTEVTAKK